MKFIQTIRFRLTLWYSLLVFLLGLILIIIINTFVTRHYNNDPINDIINPPLPLPRYHNLQLVWKTLNEEQKELVQEYRLQDLSQIRKISAFSLIPMVLISFAGGYIISGQMLKPIKNVNKAIKEINILSLHKQIDYEGPQDEIGELVYNFNRMTQRLNSSVELQKQFIANASHELKTPLAIMQTNIETIERIKSTSEEVKQQFIENALSSVEFMNNLIEDLLLLSILEKHVDMDKVNIYETTQNAIDALTDQADKRGITLTFRTGEEEFRSITISGNEVLLQRAVMNIIENAIKYSKKNSTVHTNLEVSDNSVIIRIKDTGIGISKGYQKRIFERFYRVDKSRSRKSGGTGLGLAIVKRIISLHKGTIEVSSKRGKGSTFTITLPTGLTPNAGSRFYP